MDSNYTAQTFPDMNHFFFRNSKFCAVNVHAMSPRQMRERDLVGYTNGVFLFDYVQPHALEDRSPIEVGTTLYLEQKNLPFTQMTRAEFMNIVRDEADGDRIMYEVAFKRYLSRPFPTRYRVKILDNAIVTNPRYARQPARKTIDKCGVFMGQLIEDDPIGFICRLFPYTEIVSDSFVRLALLQMRTSQRKEDDDGVL